MAEKIYIILARETHDRGPIPRAALFGEAQAVFSHDSELSLGYPERGAELKKKASAIVSSE